MTDMSRFDFKSKAEKGSRLFFKDPIDGTELDLYMDVLGADSTTFKRLERERKAGVMNEVAQSKGKKKEWTAESIEETEQEDLEMLANVVTGFGDKDKNKIVDYIILPDETKVTFNKKNVKKLFNIFPFMLDQVNSYIGNRANFL